MRVSIETQILNESVSPMQAFLRGQSRFFQFVLLQRLSFTAVANRFETLQSKIMINIFSAGIGRKR